MCDLLAHDIALAEADVMKACRQSLAHGAILLTRYAIQEINFVAEKTDALKVSKVSCETHLRIDSDDENQAPSTDIGEDNGRLNRTINYPGQDRALRIIHFIYHSRHVQGTHIFSLRMP